MMLMRRISCMSIPKFDEFNVPNDVLWFDIEHRWEEIFHPGQCVIIPHLEEMQNKLAAKRKQRYINNCSLGRLASRMADYDGQTVAVDVTSGNMIFEPVLEDGVFRFDCSGNDRISAYPSLSFIDAKVRDTPIMNKKVPLYIPTFECAHGKQIVNIELPSGTSFYGTGEVSGQLERTGERVFTWNTDAWGYGSGTTPLYQSHPWVLAVLPTGEAFGVLADTTRHCEVK
ncbi:hypothetical protein NE237_028661 [Protea cynaroides]|uniref:Glycoside hydrolase family 31 N-terminal domain-containing protein n=1 Tax=Protea cynaroides TaxID=273540 RepID=A0A9Q0JT33_9MAGN|nr:hypothetical protein NE237_028661 [Protea cynaroides]